MGVRLKKCQGPCGREKLLDEFWRDAKQADGYTARCSTCIKEAREDRKRRREAGELVPTVSEEEKLRRSERAKALHAEGRFGGREIGALGGRPSHRRPITGVVLEHFQDRPHLIIRAIESNLKSRRKSDRMRAAEFVTRLEQDESKSAREEEGGGKLPEEMTPEELRAFVMKGLRAQIAKGGIDLSSLADITLPDSAVQEIVAQ